MPLCDSGSTLFAGSAREFITMAPWRLPAIRQPGAARSSAGQQCQHSSSGCLLRREIVDLGTKVMYVYKDMKVTFVAGKVTDVQ
jgi:hypothetical protein